jgi:hypothetical protein
LTDFSLNDGVVALFRKKAPFCHEAAAATQHAII